MAAGFRDLLSYLLRWLGATAPPALRHTRGLPMADQFHGRPLADKTQGQPLGDQFYGRPLGE